MKEQAENLASSSGLVLSSVKSSSCSSNDHLWDEIDLAERYLVSAMFEEAQALASSILCKLCNKASGNDLCSSHRIHHDFLHRRDSTMEVNVGGPAEVVDMIEAAGMVLIHAYSQIGRSNKIFEVLEPFFGCIADVPSSILLAGVCLQISIGSFLTAREALESYLQDWKQRPMEIISSHIISSAQKEVYTSILLTKERYMDIAEIYAVQVLGKGLRSPELALQWVLEADVSAERRQDMIEKLQRLLVHGMNSNDKVNNPVDQTENTTKVVTSSGKAFVSEVKESQKKTEMKMKNLEASLGCSETEKVVAGNLSSSLHFFTPVVLYLSKLFGTCSMGFVMCNPKLQNPQAIFIQKKKIVGGATSLILLFILYKQRRTAKRFIWGLLHAIRVGLADLWHLAFNVQLNPLAAVQPLPSAQSIRR